MGYEDFADTGVLHRTVHLNSKERRRESPNRTPPITPQHPIVTSHIFSGDSAVFMIQWTDYSFLKITLNFHHKETELDLNRY